MAPKSIALTGNDLTLSQVYQIVYESFEVTLAPPARERMEASRALVEKLGAGEAAVYGVNTGFGALASVRIHRDQVSELQFNLVRSHACGVGAPLGGDETRAMLLLRANTLAKGFSGVRPVVVETLLLMLGRGVLPVIPSQGSVGASGDLAPLAHLALVAIGEGEAFYKGARIAGADAMREAGIAPLKLEAKEGLGLLNGTQGMLALISLAAREAEILVDSADVAAALSLDALRGSPAPFDERMSRIRPYPGHTVTARNLTQLNRGSEIRESHRSPEKDPRVQDAYSLRCTPQVHGAVRDSLSQVRTTLSIELNSATDNPLVFTESGEVISGGNFHGQPLAMAADQMAIALATLAGISERRIEHMTNPHTSGLPAFLTPDPGLNSGFMIAQVVAAGLVSEMKALAMPHSVDSIPTSGDQEDYVSMGMSAARRLRRMLDALCNVISIELLAAAQGIDFHAPLQTGAQALKAYELIRSVSPVVEKDRVLATDIEAVAKIVMRGEFQKVLQ